MEPVSNADKLQSVSIICPKCKNANVINIRGGQLPNVEWFHCSFCETNSPNSEWLVGLDWLQSIQQERDELMSALSQSISPGTVEDIIKKVKSIQQESEKWRIETFKKYPTPDAYEAACKALEKHRKRADDAEHQVNTLRKRITEIVNYSISDPTDEAVVMKQQLKKILQSIKESPREDNL